MTLAAPAPALAGRADGESTYEIRRRNRFWEIVDSAGQLVCVTVYKRGAKEVVRRLRGV